MANALSEEQWKQVLRLTEELVERPPHERQAVLDSAGAAPEIVREVLTLVDEFCALPGSLPIAGEWIGKFEITAAWAEAGWVMYFLRETPN